MRILTLPEEHARWWPQVDRFRQTPAAWHAVPWERSPWYLDLVEWAAGHLWQNPFERALLDIVTGGIAELVSWCRPK